MQPDFNLAKELLEHHVEYKEASLTHRQLKHIDILPLINKLKTAPAFTITQAGNSEQGREIFLIKLGAGSKKVFLWSQMHGDESTATMALFDIFKFFSSDDKFNNFRKNILDNLTVYFIPMLNPDGAELFQRRNYYDIDINRDAVKQQSAEGKLLKSVFDSLKPEFGFNLHDQSGRYSVGQTENVAAVSVLAPAFNYGKEINPVRGKAMRLIGSINNMLSGFIPGYIAKYSDEFEPRAFGDNFQKWGMSTVLIESGGWKNDPEKQYLRKLNFATILFALGSIADTSYKEISLDVYDKIPFNDKRIYDTILRNLRLKTGDGYMSIDIAFNQNEVNAADGSAHFTSGTIEEIGDLTGFYGMKDLDLSGLEITPGQICPKQFNSADEIANLEFDKLYSDGFTHLILNNNEKSAFEGGYAAYPINIILNSNKENFTVAIRTEKKPDFAIKSDGKVIYICINGYLRNIITGTGRIGNGVIIR